MTEIYNTAMQGLQLSQPLGQRDFTQENVAANDNKLHEIEDIVEITEKSLREIQSKTVVPITTPDGVSHELITTRVNGVPTGKEYSPKTTVMSYVAKK